MFLDNLFFLFFFFFFLCKFILAVWFGCLMKLKWWKKRDRKSAGERERERGGGSPPPIYARKCVRIVYSLLSVEVVWFSKKVSVFSLSVINLIYYYLKMLKATAKNKNKKSVDFFLPPWPRELNSHLAKTCRRYQT